MSLALSCGVWREPPKLKIVFEILAHHIKILHFHREIQRINTCMKYLKPTHRNILSGDLLAKPKIMTVLLLENWFFGVFRRGWVAPLLLYSNSSNFVLIE